MKNNIVIEQSINDAVEDAAKAAISIIVAKKAELKEKKSQLDDILLAHDGYKAAVEQAKLAAKVKKEKRDEIIKASTAARVLEDDIKELSTEKGEKQLSLFDYLLDIHTRLGRTKITDNTGQSHEIEIAASIKL